MRPRRSDDDTKTLRKMRPRGLWTAKPRRGRKKESDGEDERDEDEARQKDRFLPFSGLPQKRNLRETRNRVDRT